MKSAISLVMFVLFMCAAVTALADPAAKSTILHCGCNLAGDGLEYSEITVNSKNRGHDGHVAGDGVETCFDGVETYTDFVRTGSDCQLDGPPLGDPIEWCEEQIAGDSCGAPVLE